MLLFFSLVSLVLLLLFPDICLQGAKSGLLLWFETVLPTLFPFMVLSLFMVKTGVSEKISSLFPSSLKKLLGISQNGAYPVLIGMLSGLPVGASVSAGLYQQKKISYREAGYLICLCNNISPMFLLSFIGGHCLSLGWQRYLFLPILYLSAFISANLVCPPKESRKLHRKKSSDWESRKDTVPDRNRDGLSSPDIQENKQLSLVAACNESILSTLNTLAFVGGYIMLFSLLGNLLLSLFPHPATGVAAALLEITTGASFLAQKTAFPLQYKIILLGALSSFGGLSSIAQTSSVITEAGFSIIRYSLAKLIQAAISSLLFFLCFFR